MSMSMSGGPSRSGERNRSNSRPSFTASALVMPRAKQTAELAAEPRPWQKMSDRRQNSTMSHTIRK